MRNQKFVEDFNERPFSKPAALSGAVSGMGIFKNMTIQPMGAVDKIFSKGGDPKKFLLLKAR